MQTDDLKRRCGLPLVFLPLVWLGAVFSQSVLGDPLPLTDGELDSVSAGYVDLHGNAQANAVGLVAIAQIQVDTAQTRMENHEDGVAYTVSEITANATAIGESVYTSVSAGFETDESILSFEVQHSTVGGISYVGHDADTHPVRQRHGNRGLADRLRQRAGHGYRGQPIIHQTETVILTLVTAQSL